MFCFLEATAPQSLTVGDLDGNGTLDVATVTRFDNNVSWFANETGTGDFSSLNLVGLLDEGRGIQVSDLDSDDDFDILATSSLLDLVVWYENLDGLGNFSSRQIIDNSADGAYSAIGADIDDDGDIDVVSAADNSGLAWYENLDGQGTFSTPIVISNQISNARSIVARDIDGDGDLDIVSSSSGSVIVSWYENMDGLGTFGSQIPIGIPQVPSSTLSVFAADLDGDTDMDVITGSAGDNKVAWYENLDGTGSFSNVRLISNQPQSIRAVFSADLDNDGDIDVLSASTGDNIIAWYENDGTGIFGPQQIISTEVLSPRDVYAADIDNDGDMDVLSASQNDNKIAWYENLTILGIEEYTTNPIRVYPNPVRDILNIKLTKNTQIQQLRLFDALGRLVLHKQEDLQQIQVAGLRKGMFFLQVETSEGIFTTKVVKQ